MNERLEALWAEGRTAAEIGKVLSKEFDRNVSRGAVLGKVHRENLDGRMVKERGVNAKRTYPERKPRTRPKPAAPRPVVVQEAPEPEPASLPAPEPEIYGPHLRHTTLTISEHTCKWPIGHPKEPGFHYCGAKPVTGTPYCEEHCRIAYTSPEELRNERRRELRQQKKALGNG